jgi:hypothetical protein
MPRSTPLRRCSSPFGLSDCRAPASRPVTLTYGIGTRRATTLSLALNASLLAGCGPGTPAPAPERCAPAVPSTAQHPITRPAGSLAGDYELVQVQTQPTAGLMTAGRLHLAVPDSAARAGAVGGAARDLIGWLETIQGDSAWHPGAGSRDPNNPGAVLAGNHLRLGRFGDVNAHSEHLSITAIAPEGFWGWWKAEPGMEVTLEARTGRVLPDPAGYFCALRVRP